MNHPPVAQPKTRDRAMASGGASSSRALYQSVSEWCMARGGRALLVDVGCGSGTLFRYVSAHFERYVGVDIVRYDGFPTEPQAEFCEVNLDDARINILTGSADVTCSLETIEHVENPRAFVRELVRITKPGGQIVVTTPNQLSVASKVFFLARSEFMHFQESPGLYPAHISALLGVDLLRIARENGLVQIELRYTGDGRIPLTSRSWPKSFGSFRGWRGRAFSDNVILVATKPG